MDLVGWIATLLTLSSVYLYGSRWWLLIVLAALTGIASNVLWVIHLWGNYPVIATNVSLGLINLYNLVRNLRK